MNTLYLSSANYEKGRDHGDIFYHDYTGVVVRPLCRVLWHSNCHNPEFLSTRDESQPQSGRKLENSPLNDLLSKCVEAVEA